MLQKAVQDATGKYYGKTFSTPALKNVLKIVNNHNIDKTTVHNNGGNYSITFKTDSSTHIEKNTVALDENEYTLIKWVLGNEFDHVTNPSNVEYVLLLRKFLDYCAQDSVELLDNIHSDGTVSKLGIYKYLSTEQYEDCEKMLKKLNSVALKNNSKHEGFSYEERNLITKVNNSRLDEYGYSGVQIFYHDGKYRFATNRYRNMYGDTEECSADIFEVPENYLELIRYFNILMHYNGKYVVDINSIIKEF